MIGVLIMSHLGPAMSFSFLFSGVYHGFKERLKPKIQRVARARYGARGQVSNPLASPTRPTPGLSGC